MMTPQDENQSRRIGATHGAMASQTETAAHPDDAGQSQAVVVTADDLCELARQGVVRDVTLAGGDFRSMDLNGVYFDAVDARSADFTACILTDSHWENCRLQQACFDKADMSSASLVDCDARQGSFVRTNLHTAWWQSCNMEAADFSHADLCRMSAEQCRLAGVCLPAALSAILLVHCDLSGLDARHGHWLQVQVRNSNLPDACFTETVFEQTAFDGCMMPDADFTGVKGDYVTFHDCVLNQACFADAHLPGAMFDLSRLDRTDFRRAHLHGARLYRASATGARFTHARLDFADASHLQASTAQFNGATVHMLNVHGADLSGADWQDCDRRTVRGDDVVLRAAQTWQPDSRWVMHPCGSTAATVKRSS